MGQQLRPAMPVPPPNPGFDVETKVRTTVSRLTNEMNRNVAEQNFEECIRLRDVLKQIEDCKRRYDLDQGPGKAEALNKLQDLLARAN
eukprot:TRINITY_DN3252_c0_g1_i1.p1 TRINITY_DN3252_c0_g1~~TRINITY_DN3252_c0_g1_i1.p1  ORF type:complete len:100 (-),score=24.14 TRINITY_DN3252_c0_g1_i1:23-286(-)